MITLDNGTICAQIEEKGAELRRITVNGEDKLWNGDPQFWTGVAPVLFPISGGIKDDRFTINGKEYGLSKHGFAKNSVFTVEKADKTSAVFLLKSNEDTLKMYPWEFEFRIKYVLSSARIKIEYDIVNLSDSVMYTAVGSHEAYACEGGIENYDIIFEKPETLKSHILEGSLISRKTETVLFESNTLPLYYKYFAVDALVFNDIKSRFVTLRNRKNGKSISVEFNGFDYLLLWTKPQAGYICIEPWTNCPSYTDDGYELSEKEGMCALKTGESLVRSHTVYF